MQVTHAFPAVLEKLDLPAFDMSKIISTFVRHLAPADQVQPHPLNTERCLRPRQTPLHADLPACCGLPLQQHD